MQLISKQQTGRKMIRDLQNMCSFCARTIANLIHVNSPGGRQHFGTFTIKTLSTHLCSQLPLTL